jgi:two-component system, cell cycle sensor histidine kinase and response regulator CckA
VDVSVLARSLSIPGEREQLYGVYRDISDRVEAERALREREEELRHAQKLEAVGKLAGGIAHDFNNLLTVINGHAGFALESVEVDSPLQRDLLEIEKAGTRAAALTQQLLAYSRRQVLHPQVLDPNAVVLEIQGMLGRLIGEHIRVRTRLTQEDVRVRADRGQLEQVLVNLVVNARDAMPDGGTLSFETDALTLAPDDPRIDRWEVEAGRFVRIRVADTGIGMDADVLEHIFEPFFTTKDQGKGTGLGLATVFGIVKQSGGHITVASSPGGGTTCEVILPHTDQSEVRRQEQIREPTERPEGTVLVVEDEAPVRKLVVRILERAGCTVLAAEDGVKALRVIQEHDGQIDLVITDLVMPDMGGRDLAASLRRTHPGLPVLFMSGYDEDLLSDATGDSEFLAKPFTPAALVGVVTEALRSAPPAETRRPA